MRLDWVGPVSELPGGEPVLLDWKLSPPLKLSLQWCERFNHPFGERETDARTTS
jgi:hypothetical protein